VTITKVVDDTASSSASAPSWTRTQIFADTEHRMLDKQTDCHADRRNCNSSIALYICYGDAR